MPIPVMSLFMIYIKDFVWEVQSKKVYFKCHTTTSVLNQVDIEHLGVLYWLVIEHPVQYRTPVLGLCNSYNMDTSDLPEIYARALGRCMPSCSCVYFRQIKSAHVITNISHCPCRLIAYYGWPKATSYAELII